MAAAAAVMIAADSGAAASALPPSGRALQARSQRNLVFGVVAFDPKTGCGAACLRDNYGESVRRWAHSVRRHTDAAQTDVAIFTGAGRGSITHGDAALASALRAANVRTIEGDFRDNAQRVAHGDASRYVWCVVRNRWSVIRDYLQAHASAYRSVLMSDVRDAVVQADPFAWRPRGPAAAGVDFEVDFRSAGWHQRAVVFSGEGSGSVRTLRASKKGAPRTLQCARDASAAQRAMLLDTDPLNAGVTLGGAAAFLNFSTALAALVARVSTTQCLSVKDCTDQGLYNLLVYAHWGAYLPHTTRVVLPIERALSYTLGHKKRHVAVDAAGRVRNAHGELPPVVHQFAKGAAGKALTRAPAFGERLRGLLLS